MTAQNKGQVTQGVSANQQQKNFVSVNSNVPHTMDACWIWLFLRVLRIYT